MQRASGAAVRVCVYTDTSCASRWHVASMFIRMKATPVPLRMASSFFRAARVRSFRKARPDCLPKQTEPLPRLQIIEQCGRRLLQRILKTLAAVSPA